MKRYSTTSLRKSGLIENPQGLLVKYEDIKEYLCYTCLSILNEEKTSQEEIIRKIVIEELEKLEDRLLTAMTIPH